MFPFISSSFPPRSPPEYHKFFKHTPTMSEWLVSWFSPNLTLVTEAKKPVCLHCYFG